jgi:hypothetical protein
MDALTRGGDRLQRSCHWLPSDCAFSALPELIFKDQWQLIPSTLNTQLKNAASIFNLQRVTTLRLSRYKYFSLSLSVSDSNQEVLTKIFIKNLRKETTEGERGNVRELWSLHDSKLIVFNFFILIVRLLR